MKLLRIAAAGCLVVVGAWMAIGLSHVDATIGSPQGPDRQIRAIDDGVVEGNPAKVALAGRILRVHPIDGRAFRVLAQGQADTGQAQTLNEIAVRRAPRDRLARAAAIDHAFAEGDVETGMQHVDALLRVDTRVRDDMLQRLVLLLPHEEVQSALLERLAHAPDWRPSLAAALTAPQTPAEPAAELLERLAARTELLPAEVDARIALLGRLGRDTEARSAWLQSLPQQARSGGDAWLFDGGFEHPDINGGYGWRIAQQPALAVVYDDAAPLEGRYALAFAFAGRAVAAPGLEQSLALGPGNYRLDLAVENGTDATRPFAIEVACMGVEAPRLSLPLPAEAPSWVHSSGTFDIPETGCPGQVLRLQYLGRSLQERMVSGTLRLDAIHLNRLRNSYLQ
ncbi:hypothetical protein [Lysobacter tyrosinilyticus]